MLQDNVPVMEVYDQTKFIEQRKDKISKIKEDSKNLNDIAVDLNQEIYKQDSKLDDLNKELANDVEHVKEANKNLEEARSRSSGSNSKLMCWILIVFIFVVVLGITAYVTTKDKGDKKNSDMVVRLFFKNGNNYDHYNGGSYA